MTVHSMSDLSLNNEYPSKRPHLVTNADSDVQPPSDSVESRFPHRRSLEGRASLSNAAETRHFRDSRALIYTFVDNFDIKLDELGRLASCNLRCGICRDIAPKWPWVKGSKSDGSTSNMNNHMDLKHTLTWRNACRIDQAARDGLTHSTEAPNPSEMQVIGRPNHESFDINELNRLIAQWVVVGNQAFTAVELEEFQRILTYLKPALEGHLLQSQGIRDRVFAHAESMRHSIKQYLNFLPGLMAVACDAWTSSNRIAFLAIVGSWITHDWKLEEILLDFVELQGAHSGQNMASAVASAISELNIGHKVVALVSDNASNNGTLVNHLEAELEAKSSTLATRWDPKKGHIRCLSHIIHLSVMSLLRGAKAVPRNVDIRAFDPVDQTLTSGDAEAFVADSNREAYENDDESTVDSTVDLSSAIDKIRKITKIVRSSPQRMQLFRATAESIEDYYEKQVASTGRTYTRKAIKNLILDIITRWNSIYFMLERALEFSEAIDALTSHPKVKMFRPYALSKGDWKSMALICNWLNYFRSASTMMAAERYPTLSFSLRIYSVLISYVSRLEQSSVVQESVPLEAGVRACKSKLLEFFNKSTLDSEYYYFATILDPRFKDTLFRSSDGLASQLLSDNWVSNCTKAFKDTCDTFYLLGDSDYESKPVVITTQHANDFARDWNANRTTYLPPPNSPIAEISKYLQEDLTEMSPLKWWRLNAHRFPMLAAMARDYLCIPGTSVAVERVFSAGRDVISVRRASLSAETIRTLMNYRAAIMLEKRMERSFGAH